MKKLRRMSTSLTFVMGIVIIIGHTVNARDKTAVEIYAQGTENNYSVIFKNPDLCIVRHDLCFGKVAEKSQKNLDIYDAVNSFSGLEYESTGINKYRFAALLSNPALKILPVREFQLPGFVHQTKDYTESKEYFEQKAKSQKTIAWVLLGGGTAMTIIGLIGFNANFDLWSGSEAQDTSADIYGFVALTGMVADVISVPFFISAHHNKKIASHLSLSNQPLYNFQTQPNSLNINPSVTLKINF